MIPPSFDAVAAGYVTVNGPAMKTDQLRGSIQLTRSDLVQGTLAAGLPLPNSLTATGTG